MALTLTQRKITPRRQQFTRKIKKSSEFVRSDHTNKILNKAVDSKRGTVAEATRFSKLAGNFDSNSSESEEETKNVPKGKNTVLGKKGLEKVKSVEDQEQKLKYLKEKERIEELLKKRKESKVKQKSPIKEKKPKITRISPEKKPNEGPNPMKRQEDFSDSENEEDDKIADASEILQTNPKEEQPLPKEGPQIRPWTDDVLYSPHAPNLYQDRVFASDINFSEVEAFLKTPVLFGKTLMTNIYRYNKGSDKSKPVYMLTLMENDQFLLNAVKQKKSVGVNYLISMQERVFTKNSPAHIGKFRSNYLSTEFNVFDTGKNPNKTKNAKEFRRQFCSVACV